MRAFLSDHLWLIQLLGWTPVRSVQDVPANHYSRDAVKKAA